MLSNSLRRIASLFLTTLLVMGSVILIVAYNQITDPDKQQEALALLSQHIGRTIEVKEPITVEISDSLRPMLHLRKVQIGNAKWGQSAHSATAEDIKIELSP